MQEFALSLLLFTPLLAASIGLFIPASAVNLFRYLTLTANFLQVFILAILEHMNRPPGYSLLNNNRG
jgi:hypothetical protein